MSYCVNCGQPLSDDMMYCMNCGVAVNRSQPHVTLVSPSQTIFTGWFERFVAWLIDVILLSLVLWPVKALIGSWSLWMPEVIGWLPFVSFGMDNIVYFLYWTFMEGTYGQSIGKMIVGIRVTELNGRPAPLGSAAIASMGKAFLLPVDCLVGWILYPTRQQRLFNYLSGTTVIKTARRP